MYKISPSLKILLILFVTLSLAASLIDTALFSFGFVPFVQRLLSFTAEFSQKNYLWQPFTYPFISESFGLFSWSFAVHLLFQALLLGYLGSSIEKAFGEKVLLKLFFFTSIGAAALTLLVSRIPLAGPDAALYAFFVLFCLLQKDEKLFLFGFFEVPVKWLFAAALPLTFFTSLVEGGLTSWFVGILTGYFYGIGVQNLQSPFPLPFDRFIPKRKESKIVPLFPKESDEEFLDRMLEKISTEGEEALTSEERKKLDTVSRKKRL